MGWVPLTAVVVNVIIDGQDESARSCRLHDRRDYAALIEFVHRTQAMSQHREYSFVFDVINESESGHVVHFICVGTDFIVNSPTSLSYAIETHTTSGAITLQAVLGPNKNKITSSNSQGDQINSANNNTNIGPASSLHYVPADRVLPNSPSPMATLKQDHRNRIEQAMIIPVAGSDPDLRVDLFRGENSPSTSANIGGLSPHRIHDQQLPEESITRAGDCLGLKAYGHGINSRQVGWRQAIGI